MYEPENIPNFQSNLRKNDTKSIILPDLTLYSQAIIVRTV